MLWVSVLTVLAVTATALPQSRQDQIHFYPKSKGPDIKIRPQLQSHIERWALNPSGDAAVIKVSTNESSQLHLLAINAQYTIPSVLDGLSHPNATYAFIDNNTFLTIQPSPSSGWDIFSRYLEYDILPPAPIPHAKEGIFVGNVDVQSFGNGHVKKLLWANRVGVLAIQVDSNVKLFKVARGDGEHKEKWNVEVLESALDNERFVVQDIVVSPSQIAFTAYDRTPSSSHISLHTLDLYHPSFVTTVSSSKFKGSASSPAFGPEGQLAWLQEREGKRHLCFSDIGEKEGWEVELERDVEPTSIIFSKDGDALYLFAPYPTNINEQALYHLWTPSKSKSVVAKSTLTLIPSVGSVLDAVHVGITALNHSHLVGSVTRDGETDLWVMSHSPGDDPSDNYEQIQLTFFS